MKICDMKCKEVINICDGKIIGTVSDVDFDIRCGKICAIVVWGPVKWTTLFMREYDYVIPFECIECIGPDAVLVRVRLDEVKVKCS